MSKKSKKEDFKVPKNRLYLIAGTKNGFSYSSLFSASRKRKAKQLFIEYHEGANITSVRKIKSSHGLGLLHDFGPVKFLETES